MATTPDTQSGGIVNDSAIEMPAEAIVYNLAKSPEARALVVSWGTRFDDEPSHAFDCTFVDEAKKILFWGSPDTLVHLPDGRCFVAFEVHACTGMKGAKGWHAIACFKPGGEGKIALHPDKGFLSQYADLVTQ